jgi:hypothetical protein
VYDYDRVKSNNTNTKVDKYCRVEDGFMFSGRVAHALAHIKQYSLHPKKESFSVQKSQQILILTKYI